MNLFDAETTKYDSTCTSVSTPVVSIPPCPGLFVSNLPHEFFRYMGNPELTTIVFDDISVQEIIEIMCKMDSASVNGHLMIKFHLACLNFIQARSLKL